VTGDGADTAPLPPMMPPRRGWGIFGLGFRLANFFSTPTAGFFLISEIMAVPVRVEAKVLEHLDNFN
jgi:hypothetical protein